MALKPESRSKFFSGAVGGAKCLSKLELEHAILGLLQLQICFKLKNLLEAILFLRANGL